MPTKNRGVEKRTVGLGELSEQVIENHVGERSFRLGQQYFASEAIYRCQRLGEVIKANCYGKSADHYSLSARVEQGQIADAHCSCPVGAGGRCKHVAALLLAALHSPEGFLETCPLEQRLAECDKPKLIRLITQLVEREPDLESWLELMLPTGKQTTQSAVKPELYREQVIAAFSRAGYGWGADRQLSADLDSIRKIGDEFQAAEQFDSAVAVYSEILAGFIQGYETFQDETGNIIYEAQKCVESLSNCLPHLPDGSKDRTLAIKALFGVLRYDVNYGGICLSDEIPEIMVKHLTPSEQARVADWIRGESAANKKPDDAWARQAWGSVLIKLEGEPDDEAYLDHCREFGLKTELVERLLKLGRLDDGLREIRAASDFDLMQYADLLVAHQHHEVAHTLICQRLKKAKPGNSDQRMRDWLKRYYDVQSDWSALLKVNLEQFRERPNLTDYQEIRRIAKLLDTWEILKEEVVGGASRDSSLLIRIQLDEGNVDEAIRLFEACLKAKKSETYGFDWDWITLEVAKAAENSHPEKAIGIYSTLAGALIAKRGREHYQTACSHLKIVKQLYQRIGREDDWSIYLIELAEGNRGLRVLWEELTRAGFKWR